MYSLLVTGLEGSCTRYVSRLVAANVIGGREALEWDGVDTISGTTSVVCHRSLPHGKRDSFITPQYAWGYDAVIVAVRDFTCSLLSKVKDRQEDHDRAVDEQNVAVATLRAIARRQRVEVWSLDAAVLLGDEYNAAFIRSLGFDPVHLLPIQDPNRKYFDVWSAVAR